MCATSSRDRRLALSRQRRDRAEAAGGDRRDRHGLRTRVCDRSSRRLPALQRYDRALRGGARRRSRPDRRQGQELVFTRGATEAINLRRPDASERGRNRVLLSPRAPQQYRAVAARRLRSRCGAAHARRPDRPRRGRAEWSPKSIASSPSPTCRTCSGAFSTLGARRTSPIPRARCCCSTVARRCRGCRSTSPTSAAISTHIPGTSCTGRPASAACGAAELLEELPPWQGGGSMIDASPSKRRPISTRRRGSRRGLRTSSARSASRRDRLG
jgi:hypothetical protein